MKVAAAIIATVALVAGAACGGDGDGDEGSARAKRAIQPEAQALAESMNLELGDFPPGWRASRAAGDTASVEESRRCLGIDFSSLTILGEADSQAFSDRSSAEVSSRGTVFQSAVQAEDAVDELSSGMNSDAAERCVRDRIEEGLEGGSVDVAVGDVSVDELRLTTPPNLEEARVWRVSVSFDVKSGAAAGRSPVSYLDYVVMRDGQRVVVMNAYEVLSPFEATLRGRLLRALARRMSESRA
jgi:hypothetical protein